MFFGGAIVIHISISIVICDSVLFSYKILIGIWVISIDRICTILEN